MVLQIDKVEVDIAIRKPDSYYKPYYPPRRTIKFFLQTEKEAVLSFKLKALGFFESAMEFPIILKKRPPGIVILFCCVLLSYCFLHSVEAPSGGMQRQTSKRLHAF